MPFAGARGGGPGEGRAEQRSPGDSRSSGRRRVRRVEEAGFCPRVSTSSGARAAQLGSQGLDVEVVHLREVGGARRQEMDEDAQPRVLQPVGATTAARLVARRKARGVREAMNERRFLMVSSESGRMACGGRPH